MRTIQTRGRCALLVAIVALAAFAVPRSSSAQITLGSIDGTVTDESKGVLPGVTVTLTSPALQVPQRTAVTDAEGKYRFTDLRVGVYRIQAELPGFQTFVRESLQLDVGFAARQDIVMAVGNLAETVTVSGASPIVDVTTTHGGTTINTQVLASVVSFTGLNADLVKLTPGATGGVGTKAASPTSIGLSNTSTMSGYGMPGATNQYDDFEFMTNWGPQFAAMTEQTDVRTFGNTADIARTGPVANYVFSSGGNAFHGNAFGYFLNKPMQGDNLNARLRAGGLTVPDVVENYHEEEALGGGRILRDKLWFSAAIDYRHNTHYVPGVVSGPGPDGSFGTGDEPIPSLRSYEWSTYIKPSYQITPKYQAVALYTLEHLRDPGSICTGLFGNAGGCAKTPLESTSDFYFNPQSWYAAFRGTPTERMTFDVKGGGSGYPHIVYSTPKGYENIVPTFDRTTQQYTGRAISDGTASRASRSGDIYMDQVMGSATWFPGRTLAGRHELRSGFRATFGHPVNIIPNHPTGNYAIVYDTVGGRPHQPVELWTFTFPVRLEERAHLYGLYITDRWELTRRLTFNLGIRWEHQYQFVPAQDQEASTFVQAATYAPVDVGRWNLWAPRAAVAWDVTGGGKTVVKATYGWFNVELPYFHATFANMYNPQSVITTMYRFTSPNPCPGPVINDSVPAGTPGCYAPGSVNLDRNGPDFINVTGGKNNIVPLSPDFRVPHIHEITASVERELIPSMALRLLYVHKRIIDDYTTINVARPYSAFNIPLQRRDPGADGLIGTADDGPMVTIWDYDPAYRGAAFVQNARVNVPEDRHSFANNFEVFVTKRLANNWSLSSSYNLTKQHRWLVPVPQSPNDDYYPLDTSWQHFFRFNGSYLLPLDISVGATLNTLTGVQGQRTYVFRAADPLGGPPLRQLATVTLPLEPYGASHGPVQNYLDFRLGKSLRRGGMRFMISADLFNATNNNSAQSMSFVSGPTFGLVSQVAPPRTLRLGARLDF